MKVIAKKSGKFQTIVFCNTPKSDSNSNGEDEVFEDTIYKPLSKYTEFVSTHYVDTCIVSRFSEYLPVAYKGFVDNVYLVVHDLTPSGIVIPMDIKLKNIFCLTEWHVSYLSQIFPQLAPICVPFYYGINPNFLIENDTNNTSSNVKVVKRFIYSSFPNRGLLQLLQMWPKIYNAFPSCSLDIFSDVNNKWSNDVEPEKMAQIRLLLSQYSQQINGLGINYKGWVSKQELAEGWKQADIWFYPCTFMETFCLTALEAAASKTFVITNDLAALQTQDTRILQKVNAVHREAFGEKFPGQNEHCLRLVMERLQAGLDKRGSVNINDPDTWLIPPVEIADLARAAYYLNEIRKGF